MSDLKVRAYARLGGANKPWRVIGSTADKSAALDWLQTFPGPVLVMHTGFYVLPTTVLDSLDRIVGQCVVYCQATRALLGAEVAGYPVLDPCRVRSEQCLAGRTGPWFVHAIVQPFDPRRSAYLHREFFKHNRLASEPPVVSVDVDPDSPFQDMLASYVRIFPEHQGALSDANIYCRADFRQRWSLLAPDIARRVADHVFACAQSLVAQSKPAGNAHIIVELARAVAPWDRSLPLQLGGYAQGVLDQHAISTLGALTPYTQAGLRALPRVGPRILALLQECLSLYTPSVPCVAAGARLAPPSVNTSAPRRLDSFTSLSNMVDALLRHLAEATIRGYDSICFRALHLRLQGVSIQKTGALLGIPPKSVNGLVKSALSYLRNALVDHDNQDTALGELRDLMGALRHQLSEPSCTQDEIDQISDVLSSDSRFGLSALYLSFLNGLAHHFAITFSPFRINGSTVLMPTPAGAVNWAAASAAIDRLPAAIVGLSHSQATALADERLRPGVRNAFLRSLLVNELVLNRCYFNSTGQILRYGKAWSSDAVRLHVVSILREAGQPLHRTHGIFPRMPPNFRHKRRASAIAKIIYESQKRDLLISDPDYVFSIGRGYHALWEHFGINDLQARACVNHLVEYLRNRPSVSFPDTSLLTELELHHLIPDVRMPLLGHRPRIVSVMLQRSGSPLVFSPSRFQWQARVRSKHSLVHAGRQTSASRS